MVLNIPLDERFHSFLLRDLSFRFKKTKQNKTHQKPILIRQRASISPQSLPHHLAITPPKIRPPNPSRSMDFPEIQSELYWTVSIPLTHIHRKTGSIQAVSHVGAEESVVHADTDSLYCRQTELHYKEQIHPHTQNVAQVVPSSARQSKSTWTAAKHILPLLHLFTCTEQTPPKPESEDTKKQAHTNKGTHTTCTRFQLHW